MTAPTILLVEEDDDTRPLFREMLINNGYNVVTAMNEDDAAQRLSNPYLKVDLILVDVVGKSTEQALSIARRINQLPAVEAKLIVIAAEYDEEMAGAVVRAGTDEYVVYLDNGDELFGLLAELLKPENAKIPAQIF